MSYLFENKEKKPFKDLKREEINLVIGAVFYGEGFLERGEYYLNHAENSFIWESVAPESLQFDSIYRVKAKPYTLHDAKEELMSLFICNGVHDYGNKIDEILIKLEKECSK